jgi:hypothetical protein
MSFTSEQTKNRIISIAPILLNARQYLGIDTENDVLRDVYSDAEDDDLTEIQIKERYRREKLTKNIMNAFYRGEINENSNIADYDK